MSSKQTALVIIMTHGKNQSIALGTDPAEQITSTNTGKTNITNRDAVNVQDLPQPKVDMSEALLLMLSCHSADEEENAHGEGEHRQGPLMGSKENIAKAFSKSFNFKSVTQVSQVKNN